MKNLKKTLAVVLAFAMILGMSAISTLAFSDVAEGTVVSEAVSILSNLNIITGYEDGTFKPSETVTRAQMAAIICRMLGYEDQAASSMGATVFDDVAADHWASGYINVAQAQQIINGYGDGKFGPEDKVTYEQAVKMIVSALGYDLAAQSKGGYPTGYLAIASTKGITKSANGRVGDAAARSTIAVLAYNALEVELMDQTSWSTGAAGDEYGMTGETVLSRYLGVKKYEGVVDATPLTDIAENGYDVENTKATVGFDGTTLKAWGFSGKNYVLQTASLSGLVNAEKVADADKYLGKKVVAYIGTEADAETGEIMLYAMAEKQGSNATLKLNASQLVSDTENGQLVYKKANSNKKYDVKINLNLAYNNFEEVDTTLANTDDIITEFTNGGTIELIDSDATQNGYETAIIVNYDEEAVINEVEVDDTDIYFDLHTGNLDDIDMESETELVVVYKDGVVVEPTALAEGDTVSTSEIGSSARVLYASSKNITGSVDGWDDEYVTIAGEEYAPSAASGYAIADLQNKEGIFYLNVDGQIAYADATASKGGYFFFLNTGKDTGMGSKYYATIVGADGEAKSYNYAKNVIIDGEGTKSSEDASAYIAGRMGHGQGSNEAYAYVDSAERLLFEVKIKNGEIKNIKKVEYERPTSQSKYKAATKSIGAKTFDETSVMFALAGAYDSSAKIEEEDIKVAKVTEMLADDELYYIGLPAGDAIVNGIYTVAVGYDLVTSIADESELIVITSKKTVSYNDDIATVIEGIQAGKEVKVILYNEDEFRSNKQLAGGAEFLASDLAIGDIIATSVVNAEGVADDFKVIFDKSTGNVYAANDTDKNNYYGYQIASSADDNFIWFTNPMTGITEAGEGSNFMVIQKTANTVLVDYEEDVNEPEISKKSLSKSLIGRADKYDSYVFVRVLDEVIVDVVVYRYLD